MMCESVSVDHACGHTGVQYINCGKDPRPAEQLVVRTPNTKLVWMEQLLPLLWCYGTKFGDAFNSVASKRLCAYCRNLKRAVMRKGTHPNKAKDLRRYDWQWWNANWTNPRAGLSIAPPISNWDTYKDRGQFNECSEATWRASRNEVKEWV